MEGRAAVRGARWRDEPASGGRDPGLDVPRVLGRVEGGAPGPTLVCIAGVHGNEPAGILALQQILPRVRDRTSSMRGRFVALSGNRQALRASARFLEEDLNRAWTAERVRELRNGASRELTAEGVEQLELLDAIEAAVAGGDPAVFALDLHTTSAPGGAFTTVADTLANRAFAMSFPSPVILGLEELVDGTLLEYMGDRGFVSAVFESGQHGEREAVDRAEAAIWIALGAAGLFPESALPELPAARKRLEVDARSLPRALEMRYRHPIGDGDGFVMEPGYESFQRVNEGQVVAHDGAGAVGAPESGRLLMPLYQTQGSDGFFVVREFSPFWLRVSLVLRRMGLASVVHFLPGIGRDPDDPDTLLVNRSIARLYPLQILHLLGFRRHFDDGSKLVVRRRSHDPGGSEDDGPGVHVPESHTGTEGRPTRADTEGRADEGSRG